MKKTISLLMVLVLMIGCLTLTACGDDCDHSYGNWTTVKEATCTKDGSKERTCEECGHTETKKISALGHDYVGGVCTECGDEK